MTDQKKKEEAGAQICVCGLFVMKKKYRCKE